MPTCIRCDSEQEEDRFPQRTRGARTYRETVCKDCRAAARRQRYIDDPDYAERQRALGRKSQRRDPRRTLWRHAQRRARERGLAFNIDQEDIDLPTHCPALGIPLNYTTTSRGNCDDAPSVDRIRNDEGYVKGNVVTVSWKANALKRNATLDELQRLAAFYGALTAG